MSAIDRLYRPGPRAFFGWLLLAAVGVFLDGPPGLAPALLVAVVAAARLDRAVLGALGVVLVAAAGAIVVLDSSGGADDVHLRFVVRTLAPHHLTFVGLTLVIVGMALRGLPRSEAAPDDAIRVVPDAAVVAEPLAGWGDRLRMTLTILVTAAAAALALALLLT